MRTATQLVKAMGCHQQRIINEQWLSYWRE